MNTKKALCANCAHFRLSMKLGRIIGAGDCARLDQRKATFRFSSCKKHYPREAAFARVGDLTRDVQALNQGA